MPRSWQNFRVILLILVFFGIFASLARLILFPSPPSQREFEALEFPDSVDLPPWEAKISHELPLTAEGDSHKKKFKHVISAHQYQFSKAPKTLTIDMRYIVDTDGETSKYLNQFYDWKTSSGKLDKFTHLEEGIGYYSLHVREDKTVLTSCINPNGESTVLGRQFVSNRNISDIKLNRLLPWFLNQISLKDERCLWVYMMLTSEENTTQEKQFKTLRDAWFTWYREWKVRFPNEY